MGTRRRRTAGSGHPPRYGPLLQSMRSARHTGGPAIRLGRGARRDRRLRANCLGSHLAGPCQRYSRPVGRPVVVLFRRRLGSPWRHSREMGHGTEDHGLPATLSNRAGARPPSARGVLRELGDPRVGTFSHPDPHRPPSSARYPRRHEGCPADKTKTTSRARARRRSEG